MKETCETCAQWKIFIGIFGTCKLRNTATLATDMCEKHTTKEFITDYFDKIFQGKK